MSNELTSIDVINVDCVVVGAGWTGLATAAALRAYGVSRFVVLESGTGVGAFWEGNYDRIRLHTPWHGLPCDGGLSLYDYPMFKTKREILGYLTDYCRLHQLEAHTRFGERVTRVARQEPGRWVVATAAEWGRREFHCSYVAICTSKLRVPYVPQISGHDYFPGRIMHSREYKSGSAFRGQEVLVVGSGNSAAEISADLIECGANKVTMLVNGPRLFIPLHRLAPMYWMFRLLGRLGEAPAYADWLCRFGTDEYWEVVRRKDGAIASMAVDMSHVGIGSPDLGFSEANIKYGRIGTFDQGAIQMIGDGRIMVRNGKLVRFSEDGACLGDGTAIPADVVVLATGFQPRLEEFFEEPDLFLQANQEGKGTGTSFLTPRTDTRGRSTVDSSLFFVGFDQAVNGGLAMGFWGWSCGFLISQGLGLLPTSATFSLGALPERQSDVCRRRSAGRLTALALAMVAAAAAALGARQKYVLRTSAKL